MARDGPGLPGRSAGVHTRRSGGRVTSPAFERRGEVRDVGGSSTEPVLSRVAGPKALPQRPGWWCGDQSQWMGPRSYLLWEWRPDAARPLSRGGVAGFECLRTASGWAAEPFVLCAEGRPRARREMRHRSRVDPLPSSEAEIGFLLGGSFATLERDGDCPAEPRGTLERGGDCSVGSRGM